MSKAKLPGPSSSDRTDPSFHRLREDTDTRKLVLRQGLRLRDSLCFLIGALVAVSIYRHYCQNEAISPPPPPPFAPPGPALPPGMAACVARKTHRVFGHLVKGGDEIEEGEEGEEYSLALDNRFLSAFVNKTCVLAGGTGDPCDIHVGEAYADEVFKGMEVEYSASMLLSDIALFSVSQLGGIPRPTGTFYW